MADIASSPPSPQSISPDASTIASTVAPGLTSGAAPAIASIDTGAACNNRCSVCPRPASADSPAAPATAADSEALAKLPGGTGAIVVHGGEPTLSPALEAILRAARDAGRALTLDTNARAFSVEGRALRLRQAGLAHAVITLHGAREASHDFLTRTPGSFRQTVAGAMRLKAAGVRITARLIVTRTSALELPAMATVALGLGAQAVRFSWARMEARPGMPDLAAQNAEPKNDEKGVLRVDPNTPAGDREHYDQGREWLVPRYPLAEEALAAAVRAVQKVGRPVAVDGIPLCRVPAGAAVTPTAPTCATPGISPAHAAGSDSVAAPDTFAPACTDCTVRARCPGLPSGYFARFGGSDLRPVLPAVASAT